MKRALILMSTFFALLASAEGHAASRSLPSRAELAAAIQQISQQTKALQRQVRTLKAEVRRLRGQKGRVVRTRRAIPAPQQAGTHVMAEKVSTHPVRERRNPNPVHSLDASRMVGTKHEGKHGIPKHLVNSPYMIHFKEGVTVVTSPFMGLRTSYSPTDLLEYVSTMNEDLTLLQQKMHVEEMMESMGFSMGDRPVLVLSGGLEGQVLVASGYGGARSDVNLNRAEFDIEALASRWATAFMSFQFDDSPPATGSRVTNSRVYLARGFLTIGDLHHSPVYFSLGQMYVPFGRYRSGMLSTPLTASLAQTLVRTGVLGFTWRGVYAELYGYRGNQRNGGNSPFKQGGFNLGYQQHFQNSAIDAGVGIISSMTDSQGMENNRLPFLLPPQFQGFGLTPGGNFFAHRVPGLDGHVEWTLGPATLIGEYIMSTTAFAPSNLLFAGTGARVRALHAELDYLFHFGERPLQVGVAYGQTWEAFALNLPHYSYTAFLNTTIWKETVESLEFRHDQDYRTNPALSGGAGLPIATGGVGGTRNSITFRIGVYF